eukprot:scaffold31226_cov22-Phaeocystis_antarctica.AAC.1
MSSWKAVTPTSSPATLVRVRVRVRVGVRVRVRVGVRLGVRVRVRVRARIRVRATLKSIVPRASSEPRMSVRMIGSPGRGVRVRVRDDRLAAAAGLVKQHTHRHARDHPLQGDARRT